MGKAMNWQKATDRERGAAAARERRTERQALRKKATTPAQRAKLVKLGEELGREVAIPAMSYDARLEIDRLQRVADFKKRQAAR